MIGNVSWWPSQQEAGFDGSGDGCFDSDGGDDGDSGGLDDVGLAEGAAGFGDENETVGFVLGVCEVACSNEAGASKDGEGDSWGVGVWSWVGDGSAIDNHGESRLGSWVGFDCGEVFGQFVGWRGGDCSQFFWVANDVFGVGVRCKHDGKGRGARTAFGADEVEGAMGHEISGSSKVPQQGGQTPEMSCSR